MDSDIAGPVDRIPAAPGPARRNRILAVDDEPRMLRLIQLNLEQNGYRVETATNGLRALAALRYSRPDILISDVMMPEMNGLELLSAVRVDPDLHDLPVILLTAREDIEQELEGLQNCRAEHLTKPFTPAELLSLVGDLLEGEERSATEEGRIQ